MKDFWLGVLFGACLLGLFREVKAEEIWGTISIRSYHSNRAPHYNENNAGIGLEISPPKSWDLPKDTRLVTGFYDNSFHKETIYAGASYTPLSAGNFHFGIVGVFVSGYPNTAVLGAGAVTFERNNYGFNLLLIPKIPTLTDTSVAAVQLKFKF